MALVTIRIDIELDVDDDLAQQIRSLPPKFLCINNEPLGSEELTFNVLNGNSTEPSRLEVTVLDE